MRIAFIIAALFAMTLSANAECFASKADFRSVHKREHMSWHHLDGKLCYHTVGKPPRRAAAYGLATPAVPHPRTVQMSVPPVRWALSNDWLSFNQQQGDVEKEVMATSIADRLHAAPWIMAERWNFPP
jgi:hypothetical protein